MTTYSVRDSKAKASVILRELEEGDEVIITRRGKPCAKLTSVPPPDSDEPSLATLEGARQGRLALAAIADSSHSSGASSKRSLFVNSVECSVRVACLSLSPIWEVSVGMTWTYGGVR